MDAIAMHTICDEAWKGKMKKTATTAHYNGMVW